MPTKEQPQKTASLFSLLKPYSWLIFLLILLTVVANSLNLAIPKIISSAIDTFTRGTFVLNHFIVTLSVVAVGIFIFTYLQNIVQVYAAERVARDLRNKLATKISEQNTAFVTQITPAKLLTNITSDVDAIKSFVSQAIASIISSVFLIIGASVLLFMTNWHLASVVLLVVPCIGVTFFLVLRKVRTLFTRSQEAIDWLNKVINESILGAALIRLVNSQQYEYQKFLDANTEAKTISLSILNLFASLVPLVTFLTNVATLLILVLGGHFVITGSMTLGGFTAFNSYLSILIFPILIISFMTNVIAQASASFGRIQAILTAPLPEKNGTRTEPLRGTVALKDITLTIDQKAVLKNISLQANPRTRTAIIGPTAAGKTQLLYVITGLTTPTAGTVLYDNHDINTYEATRLHAQIGFVFQDSILFNMTLRENIAFSTTVSDADLEKAIATAELYDFITALPQGLDTIVSERGTSLSGGQKQRVMLARALALNPTILLLDDFTARVDTPTEKKILQNIATNYPDITLISVTQKITAIEHYTQIILLMDGEILARGTHDELMHTSPEYMQIYNSQESTEQYEIRA